MGPAGQRVPASDPQRSVQAGGYDRHVTASRNRQRQTGLVDGRIEVERRQRAHRCPSAGDDLVARRGERRIDAPAVALHHAALAAERDQIANRQLPGLRNPRDPHTQRNVAAMAGPPWTRTTMHQSHVSRAVEHALFGRARVLLPFEADPRLFAPECPALQDFVLGRTPAAQHGLHAGPGEPVAVTRVQRHELVRARRRFR